MADECFYYYYDSWNGGYCCKARKEQGKSASVNSDTVHHYCWNHYTDCPYYKEAHGNSSDGGCYLTSACVEARGLADNCKELTTLRHFRDTYIRQQPQGYADVARYYATAPRIVEAIKETGENARLAFDKIYREMVIPCVELIEKGELQTAYQRYKDYALMLETQYLPKNPL